jgi:hypothetical protein
MRNVLSTVLPRVGSVALALALAGGTVLTPTSQAYAYGHGGGGGRGGGGWHGGGGWGGGGWGWGLGLGALGVGLGVDALLGWPGYYPYGPYAYEPYPYAPYAYGAAYPYYGPAAPMQAVQQAPAPMASAPQSWYYCDNPKGYYPYVQSCRNAWRPVSPTPPQVP